MLPFLKTSIELQSVKLKRPEFDLKRGLLHSTILPGVPIEVESERSRTYLEEETPVDGAEIVGWMHYAAADNATFGGATEEYNRLGSQVLSGSSDPWLPGLRVGDVYIPSRVTGSTVRTDGYATVRTPRGDFRVPVGGKATFAREDILAWGRLPWAGSYQWVLSLLQWRELASTPVTERVRFPSSYGMVAPQFFSCSTRVPAPLGTYRIGLTSNRAQTVVLRGRGTSGAFHEVLFEDKFDIEAGESEVVYNVFGLPFSPAFTMELQPTDGSSTILDYIEQFP